MKYGSKLKVLLTAIVCATVASTSFAQTGEVYSLNVVGFQKVSALASGGLVLSSTPFDRDTANLDNVLGTNGIAGATLGAADNCLMYDKYTQSYLQYWLFSHTNPTLNRHWRGTAGLSTNVYLLPGQGFWYRNRASSDMTLVMAGDVVDVGAVTNLLVPGLQMLSYPFSTSIRMTDMTLTNGVAGATLGGADNIMMYVATNQSFNQYWLFSHTNPTLNRKWRSAAGLATNVFVQPGQGFWYRSRLTTSNLWVEVKPYTL
jgi:hypothetical protein